MPEIPVRIYDFGDSAGRDRYSVFVGDNRNECLSLYANADSEEDVCQSYMEDEQQFSIYARIPLADLTEQAFQELEMRVLSDNLWQGRLVDDPEGLVVGA